MARAGLQWESAFICPISGIANDTARVTSAATLDVVEHMTRTTGDKGRPNQEQPEADSGPPSMAVSIAGISTACSKDALVSSAKAVKEALSTD